MLTLLAANCSHAFDDATRARGKGAVRLHEELLTVTARWAEVGTRRAALSPYGREAEAKTMELLEQSLRAGPGAKVPPTMAEKLLASIPKDAEELLSHLEARGQEAKREAETKLNERGRLESDGMRKILEDQKQRVVKELGKAPDPQMMLNFSADEKRQHDLDRRAWDRFILNVDGDLSREPARILEFYKVASFRIEPVGIAYLWPITG